MESSVQPETTSAIHVPATGLLTLPGDQGVTGSVFVTFPRPGVALVSTRDPHDVATQSFVVHNGQRYRVHAVAFRRHADGRVLPDEIGAYQIHEVDEPSRDGYAPLPIRSTILAALGHLVRARWTVEVDRRAGQARASQQLPALSRRRDRIAQALARLESELDAITRVIDEHHLAQSGTDTPDA
ncbi:hypothetical protein [Amycolatopsis anabasis]|uniref:hypothetical protein n=1 Tax=Amycolatopsis anabasis TaxID=1840409 RepID=UPI00131E50CC|nr:hypothetical protein [Amycolatopsis anabasis]